MVLTEFYHIVSSCSDHSKAHNEIPLLIIPYTIAVIALHMIG